MEYDTDCRVCDHSQGSVGDGQRSLWLHGPRATTCTVDRETSCARCTRQAPVTTIGIALTTYTTSFLVALELNPGGPTDR